MATKRIKDIATQAVNGTTYHIEARYDEIAVCIGVFLIVTEANGERTEIATDDESRARFIMKHLIEGDYDLDYYKEKDTTAELEYNKGK